jgi:hypothetical protein
MVPERITRTAMLSGYFLSRGEAKIGFLFLCTWHLGYFLSGLFPENSFRAQTAQILVLTLAC